MSNVGRTPRNPSGWLKLRGVTRNNLDHLDVDIPLGVFTSVTGISGSGKSSLISQFLVEAVGDELGQRVESGDEDDGLDRTVETLGGEITEGLDGIKRLVVVDQKPIGRTPRSNLATYTGLFDHVRKLFAATKQARARRYDAGRFSFNVAKGRCETCQGEGFVCVELLFLPSVYAPCPTCKGARYNAKTLEIKIRDKSIADVLAMTVDGAFDFFSDDPSLRRSLGVLREVGLGYIRLGQAATELSGGEAQRIKLATELQRAQRGETLYVLDEPTTGLHPSDVAKLMTQLDGLVGVRQHGHCRRARHEASRRRATGSSTSGRERATRAAGSSRLDRPTRLRPLRKAGLRSILRERDEKADRRHALPVQVALETWIVLPDHLALLVGRQESDVGCIAAASYPDDAFDRSKPCGVDEPPAIRDVDFENGMKVRRIQLQRIGADGSGRNSQCPGQE